jgi:hypothetical protein
MPVIRIGWKPVFRSHRARALHGCALIFIAVLLALAAPISAAAATAPPQTTVAPAELDRSIERVLERREYAWRLPRIEPKEQKKGVIQSFLDDVAKAIGTFFRWLNKMFWKLVDWLSPKAEARDPTTLGGLTVPPMQTIVIVVAVVAVALVIWSLVQKRRRLKAKVVTALAAEAVPDLHREDVTADLLPEERWLQLARELLEQGDLRLALRAAYLGVLAHLGQRELLAIARHKSNLDYRRELARRAVQRRELVGAFEENVFSFERAWYGRATVTREVIERFLSNLEIIRGGAQ